MTFEIEIDDYDCYAKDDRWRFGVYLDPEAERVSHWSVYGYGTPLAVKDNRADIVGLPSGAVGTHVIQVLNSEEFRALVSMLFAMYDGLKWNGSSHIGRWNEDRSDVLQSIECLFHDVPTYSSASDWMNTVWTQDEADSIRARIREGETLEQIAIDMTADALVNDAYLDESDMLSTLEALLREFEEETQGEK